MSLSCCSWKAASAFTVGTVGILSKLFLYGGQSITTKGQAEFVQRLQNRKRPIITVCNHISVYEAVNFRVSIDSCLTRQYG